MMHENRLAALKDAVASSPVIAAVKDEAGLGRCLETDCQIVFILFGNICNIAALTAKVRAAGKYALVHVDLVAGLSAKEISVEFIQRQTEADGIISTKPQLIRRARELGFFTVQRFFILDSIALDNVKKQIEVCNPDLIEILPGLMPKVIARLCRETRLPVVAGGLITDKEDVMTALGAGAVAISTTNEAVWRM